MTTAETGLPDVDDRLPYLERAGARTAAGS
jgi:hypothetical protein